MTKTPKAPEHLSASSKRLWKAIFEDYEIDTAAEIVLVATLEAVDRREQARIEIAKSGATFLDRFGQPKVSPWCGIERDAAATAMRGWRLMGFDQEPRGGLGIPERR